MVGSDVYISYPDVQGTFVRDFGGVRNVFHHVLPCQMGCTASCKSCEGVAQNYSVDIGAPDDSKDPDEVNEENEENEGEENPAELYKDFLFFWRGVPSSKKIQETCVHIASFQNFICYTHKTYMTMGKTNI